MSDQAQPRLLFLGTSADWREAIKAAQSSLNGHLIASEDYATALEHFRRDDAEVVLAEIEHLGDNGAGFLEPGLSGQTRAPLVVLARSATIEKARQLMIQGAWVCLENPDRSDFNLAHLRKALEHRRLQKRLARLEENADTFRILVENSPDIIMRYARDLKVIYANPSIERITGVPLEKILGKTAFEAGFEKEYATFWTTTIQKVFDTGKPVQVKFEFRSPHGPISNDWHLIPEMDAHGQVSTVFGTARDISHESALEKQIRQSQKMQAIGTLAGGIAHDFNNILMAILGFADIAGSRLPANHPAQADLNQVMKAGNRAASLVQQILTFSREQEQKRAILSPEPIIKEVVKFLRSTLPSTIQIRAEITPNAGNILADPVELHQVLMNLSTNAYHAMTEKGGILSIRLGRVKGLPQQEESTIWVEEDCGWICLSVEDTGCGIAPTILERIFEPFFTTKPVGQGAGLGLATTHGIVTSSGGFIRVKSHLGRGSVFSVFFPTHHPEAPQAFGASKVVCGGSERILFVDDEEILCTLAKEILESIGYRVTTYLYPRVALEAFRQNPDAFDLIITDQTMPELTGEDVAREVLSIKPSMPVIIMTGHSSLISPEKVRELGIRELLLKPITRASLDKHIRQILDS